MNKSKKESISRRSWVKTAGGTIVGLAVGAAAGYFAKPTPEAEVEKVVETKTVTQTVTAAAEKPEVVKIAGMVDCTRDDMSWGQCHYQAMKAVEDKYPNVEISYSESVPWADIEKLYRDYAEEGYQIVGWWGFQGAEPCVAASPDYPDTQFYFTCVTNHTPNAVSFVYLEEETGYMAGLLAGLLTETNIVGVFIGTDSPCGNAYANAYELAAKTVNPKVKVLKAYAGHWVDPAKGKETALALFDAGADHLGKYAAVSDLGGFDACKERNVYTTGIYLDQSPLAPDLTLANFLFDPLPILDKFVMNTLEGFPPMGGQIPCGFPPMFNSFQKIQRTPAFDKLPSDVKDTFNDYATRVEKGGFKIQRDESRFAVA